VLGAFDYISRFSRYCENELCEMVTSICIQTSVSLPFFGV